MRAGFILPQLGPAATPQANVTVAQRAEALGYASLWVTERLLWPLAPQSPFPATPDGALPEVYQRALDPLETLTFVAAHTRRIGLGTSVLNMPFYNPVVLARRLTTLDVLSGGRLRVGLGLGWSKDEYDATGASFTKGRRPPGRRVPAGAEGHLDDRPGRVRGRVLPPPPLHHRDQARATTPSPHLPGPVDPCRPAAGGEIRRRLAPHRWAATHAGDPTDDGRAQASGPGGGPGPGRDGRDSACARHHHAAAAR